MTTTVRILEAKTHLSDLLARVEAGEDFVIARGNDPIAHVTPYAQGKRSSIAARRSPRRAIEGGSGDA